jgi:two-component system, LytTR family, sensor kinase
VTEWAVALAALVGVTLVGVILARLLLGRDRMSTPADIATYNTLHTASQAAPMLRAGLTPDAAQTAVKPLRSLLGVDALAITDRMACLGWDGIGNRNPEAAVRHARAALQHGETAVLNAGLTKTASAVFRSAVCAPLTQDDVVVGALVAYSQSSATPAMVRAVEEVAAFASGQLDLAELDRTRSRSAEAEVRALRAQISPHFVYNSLTAIASFVRTDPDRARELLLDFAEFTQYSFRTHGQYTTLAEELQSIEQYLLLEQARFGERLQVRLRVDQEVLGVRIPFLCIQPLVENAVRHGLEAMESAGTVSIVAQDRGSECVITVEDDGVGNDPDIIRRSLSGEPGQHVGLANVDERLRTSFGDEYGLVVETAPQAGTKVIVRVPKFAREVTLT